jgi:hypothetical protein
MTQFILVIGIQPQNIGVVCHSIDEADKFQKDIAHELFTNEQLKYCWCLKRESVHDLFSQAQLQISEGENIEKTIIGKLLLRLFRSCQEIVLWYSADFNDLPEFTDIEAAMNEISSALMESDGEVYLRFRGGVDNV